MVIKIYWNQSAYLILDRSFSFVRNGLAAPSVGLSLNDLTLSQNIGTLRAVRQRVRVPRKREFSVSANGYKKYTQTDCFR